MIDFSSPVLDPRGQELKNGDETLTLARACELALDAGLPSDQNEGWRPKMHRGELIEKIVKGGQFELPAKDITLIQERVAALFTAASTVRTICRMLDPATE